MIGGARGFLCSLRLNIELQRFFFEYRHLSGELVGTSDQFGVLGASGEETARCGVGARGSVGDHATAIVDQSARTRGNAAAGQRPTSELNRALNGVDNEGSVQQPLGERTDAGIDAHEFKQGSRACDCCHRARRRQDGQWRV